MRQFMQAEESPNVIEVSIEQEVNPVVTPSGGSRAESAHSTRDRLDRCNSSHDDETMSTVSLIQLERMQPMRLKSAKSTRRRQSQHNNSCVMHNALIFIHFHSYSLGQLIVSHYSFGFVFYYLLSIFPSVAAYHVNDL